MPGKGPKTSGADKDKTKAVDDDGAKRRAAAKRLEDDNAARRAAEKAAGVPVKDR